MFGIDAQQIQLSIAVPITELETPVCHARLMEDCPGTL